MVRSVRVERLLNPRHGAWILEQKHDVERHVLRSDIGHLLSLDVGQVLDPGSGIHHRIDRRRARGVSRFSGDPLVGQIEEDRGNKMSGDRLASRTASLQKLPKHAACAVTGLP